MTSIGFLMAPNSRKQPVHSGKTSSNLIFDECEGRSREDQTYIASGSLQTTYLRQPPVTNVVGRTLGVNGLNEGRVIAKARCTKIKDLWDWEDREWKSLLTLGMNSHIINRTNKDIIISNIPWNPITFPNRFQTDNWISTKTVGHLAPFAWIYRVMGVLQASLRAVNPTFSPRKLKVGSTGGPEW
jgi:hypothetical protein